METRTVQGRVFTPDATMQKIAKEIGLTLGVAKKNGKTLQTATLKSSQGCFEFEAEDNTKLLIKIIKELSGS